MNRNKTQVADISAIVSGDRITHSSRSDQAYKTAAANLAASDHFKSDNHPHQNSETLLSSYIMTEEINRAIQPASLATKTTCTTIQPAAMRQRRCLTRLESSSSKKANAFHAKLIAILGPLVVYSLFQVTANLLKTHNNANNHNQQATTIASPTSITHNLCIKSAKATHHQQSSCRSFESNQLDARLRHPIVRLNNQPQESFYETISQALSNDDESDYQKNQEESPCSSVPSQAEKISAPSLSYWHSLLSELVSASTYLHKAIEHATLRPIFGLNVLMMAEAARAPSTVLTQHNREIIVLNSTNFNNELIQHEHPFPHIKLIEYYLSYCGICLKFKPTYTELAREIFSWRNVIRVSEIDLGVSSNSPIAHSWSVDVVPTLRLHPPPREEFASQLAKQLSSWSAKQNSRELQKSLYEEYNGTKLMISSLQVIKYTNDGRGSESNLADKVAQLKLDLLQYIERYVRENPNALPSTWPNLRPVKEKTLAELRRHHPRQELFLIIEADHQDEPNQSSTSNSQVKRSLAGLNIMMELSSTASWQAIRYVKANENQELIQDVIAHKRREFEDKTKDGQLTNNNNQMDLLNNLITNKQQATNGNNNNILLIHIDYSHSPAGQMKALSKLPFITIVTGSDLTTVELSAQYDQQQQQQQNGIGSKAKRAINQSNSDNGRQIAKRSLFSSSSSNELDESMSLKRKIELVTLYINQTYTETEDDRKFVSALSKLDSDPTSGDLKREVAEVSRTIRQSIENQNLFNSKMQEEDTLAGIHSNDTSKNVGNNSSSPNNEARYSVNLSIVHSPPPTTITNVNINTLINDQDPEDDYEDKLRAIRYIFFQEIPRKSLNDKSLAEKQEKLNTLLNLVSVIKAYFPFPDSASIQFIDGIQNYLLRQQHTLLNLIQTSTTSVGNLGFDTRALKQELRRLELEGKRLPQIKEWKHCKFGGYSCALWRLFHTLTAFEYKKLIQINQQSTSVAQPQVKKQQPLLIPPENQSASLMQTDQRVDQQPTAASLLSSHNLEQQSQQNSPVERLVSSPSTTTSLSLTIATPVSSQQDNNNTISKRQQELDLLPTPVLLVMRDYVTQFFSCDDCARKFLLETAGLSLERIRQQEPAEFSILWLWETHNRVSKRLSVNPETNPPEHPKKWFPTYNQCQKCYKKPPSYLMETNLEFAAIFHESIEWDREEVLIYLLCQYTRQPMDNLANIFGYQVPCGVCLIVVCSLLLIILLRFMSCYIERQKKQKASLLNSNGYSMELQRNC